MNESAYKNGDFYCRSPATRLRYPLDRCCYYCNCRCTCHYFQRRSTKKTSNSNCCSCSSCYDRYSILPSACFSFHDNNKPRPDNSERKSFWDKDVQFEQCRESVCRGDREGESHNIQNCRNKPWRLPRGGLYFEW